MTFRLFLEQFAPTVAMLDWIGNKTVSTAWADCPRMDWMLYWISRGTITPAVSRLDLIRFLASAARESDVKLSIPESRLAMYLNNARRGQDITVDDADMLLNEGRSPFIACVRNFLATSPVDQQGMCKWASLAIQALMPDKPISANLGHLVRLKFPNPPRFRGIKDGKDD